LLMPLQKVDWIWNTMWNTVAFPRPGCVYFIFKKKESSTSYEPDGSNFGTCL
jgi:hypothetical protein